ncbi:hypothetical protein ACIBCB_03040 [Streptomyces uncialis]|uniref:hypothetical protein n=1 Tax=Streptomyces uncialis TaxID=1048205 RepID=UPI00224D67FC|nr:hypothetical protein [Streptomyces uncialis]MCX4659283.1 hypothetical protein [Streptomyces uncialis]
MRKTMLTAALAAATLLVPALAGTAQAAPASGWHCKTSSKTVDHPGSTAVWDDFDFKVKTCAKRSGGTIYAKATVDIDGPPGFYGYSVVNSARALVQVKRSVSGPDPVSKHKYGPGLGSKMNNLNTSGNALYTSPTVSHKAGAGSSYYGDSVLQIDWKDDGKGLRSYAFSASPRV